MPSIFSGIGMVVRCEGGVAKGQTNLTVFGTTESGVFNSATMFVEGGNNVSRGVNLFTAAPDTGDVSASMNMSISGNYVKSSNNTTLFVSNSYQASSSGFDMVIQGKGQTSGASPAEASMNLFIERPTTAQISMVLFGPGAPATGDVNLYMNGASVESGVVPMSIPDVIGYESDNVSLYTHGW